MVTHRWWGNKFCKRTCKGAYLRELALGRDEIHRRNLTTVASVSEK